MVAEAIMAISGNVVCNDEVMDVIFAAYLCWQNQQSGTDMAEAKVVEQVSAPIDAVWQIVSDFGGMRPRDQIEAVRFEGKGVGMTRYISLTNGEEVVERLEQLDGDTLTFTYAIINQNHPLPFRDYSATVSVIDKGDGTCAVEWTGTFDAIGDEAAAIRLAEEIYRGAIERARTNLRLN